MISNREKPSILVVASPTPTSGGGLRAHRSLKEYVKHFDTYLFIPWGLWGNKKVLKESAKYFMELKRLGMRFAGFSQLPKAIHKSREALGTRILETLVPLMAPSIVHLDVGAADYQAVVVLHEVWDAVYSGIVLAEHFNAPSAVLLQLPPFYGSRKRLLNILKVVLLWRELIGDTPSEKEMLKIEAVIRSSAEERLSRLHYERVLRRYKLVLGVSKAIAVEMGGEWLDKVTCLNPGVSLDEEDLEIMKSIRRRVGEKENYIVFGGRLSVDKGLVEALISLKTIARLYPNTKLILTGRIAPTAKMRIAKICKKLGVEDKVVFTGFVSREKRFEIVAKAKLMLYPSHVDAFPYAVLESLHLKTPVVGYRIPALEIYYSRCPGVELVEEGDVEALTVKAIEILEKGVKAIEPPKIKNWKDIMNEEIKIIKGIALK
uniref:Glycosyltransferase n=1 Tax=Ignisphaera aggregans TaxID=334771 RepID=A0A7J2U4S9_9CREN